MALTLRIRGGKNDGLEVRVAQKKRFMIGRAEDCNMRPTGDKVSRYHCVILVEEPDVVLRDMGSTNGTFVNGVRVSAPIPLRHGDLVTVGKIQFECLITSLRGSAAVAPPAKKTAALPAEGEWVDLDEGVGAGKTGDTQVLNAEEAASLGLDLAGPAPAARFRPPTFNPRSSLNSAMDTLRNSGPFPRQGSGS